MTSVASSLGAEFPEYLHVIRQLGRGAYGTVHLCEDTRTQTQVAVKHVKQAARHGKSMLREIRLLARLGHENILHLHDFPPVSGPDFQDVFLILPYMATDLHKVIQSRQSLTDKHVQVIFCQICRALGYLHTAGVAHRDLKPANVLVTADCKLKICDFGLARKDMSDPTAEPEEAVGVLTEHVVTRWYRAPEVMLLPKQYSTALDLWAVGCILFEILGRKAIFAGKNHFDMITKITQTLGTPPDSELSWLPKTSVSYKFLRNVCQPSKGQSFSSLYPMATHACIDLIVALLHWDPSKRLSAMACQEHEYLRSYLPRERPTPPELFDWSFDGFKPTVDAVRERLYRECLRFNPQMAERDHAGGWRDERQQTAARAPLSTTNSCPCDTYAPVNGKRLCPRTSPCVRLRQYRRWRWGLSSQLVDQRLHKEHTDHGRVGGLHPQLVQQRRRRSRRLQLREEFFFAHRLSRPPSGQRLPKRLRGAPGHPPAPGRGSEATVPEAVGPSPPRPLRPPPPRRGPPAARGARKVWSRGCRSRRGTRRLARCAARHRRSRNSGRFRSTALRPRSIAHRPRSTACHRCSIGHIGKVIAVECRPSREACSRAHPRHRSLPAAVRSRPFGRPPQCGIRRQGEGLTPPEHLRHTAAPDRQHLSCIAPVFASFNARLCLFQSPQISDVNAALPLAPTECGFSCAGVVAEFASVVIDSVLKSSAPIPVAGRDLDFR